MVESGAGRSARWHQALAYAVTGRCWPELGQQEAPDLTELDARLRTGLDPESLRGYVHRTLAAGKSWPHPVPTELMAGLGYAQFTAALTALRSGLGLDGPTRVAAEPAAGQPASAAERRLLEEVPPHHGT
jgi:hypothetical protein